MGPRAQAYFWNSVSSKADDDIVGAFYGIVIHTDKRILIAFTFITEININCSF